MHDGKPLDLVSVQHEYFSKCACIAGTAASHNHNCFLKPQAHSGLLDQLSYTKTGRIHKPKAESTLLETCATGCSLPQLPAVACCIRAKGSHICSYHMYNSSTPGVGAGVCAGKRCAFEPEATARSMLRAQGLQPQSLQQYAVILNSFERSKKELQQAEGRLWQPSIPAHPSSTTLCMAWFKLHSRHNTTTSPQA